MYILGLFLDLPPLLLIPIRVHEYLAVNKRREGGANYHRSWEESINMRRRRRTRTEYAKMINFRISLPTFVHSNWTTNWIRKQSKSARLAIVSVFSLGICVETTSE
jgi:hypothetical protein